MTLWRRWKSCCAAFWAKMWTWRQPPAPIWEASGTKVSPRRCASSSASRQTHTSEGAWPIPVRGSTYGHHLGDTMYEYLVDNGMTREEYHWFLDNHVKNRCVMGNDYYATNENLVHRDGSTSLAGETFGYYPVTHQYLARYRLPVMHTDTNNLGRHDPINLLRS